MHSSLTMLRPSRFVAAAAATLIALAAREGHAQVCVQEDCLPPAFSAYGGPFTHHFSFFGTTVDFGDLSLHNFSVCGAPPPSVPNATTDISFTALMDFKLSVNGAPAVPGQCSANATLHATFNHQAGTIRYYDTEMVQLDLFGGGLGSTMIRESPTHASTGPTTIEDLGGGSFRIDSFFDVFFELSLDGGVTWAPANNDPGNMTLTGPGCPTPIRGSTWGRVKLIYR